MAAESEGDSASKNNMMNGGSHSAMPAAKDGNDIPLKELSPRRVSKEDVEGGGDPSTEEDQSVAQPSNKNNLQQNDVSPENNIEKIEKESPPISAEQPKEGNGALLTVIDGPLAKGDTHPPGKDEGSEGGTTAHTFPSINTSEKSKTTPNHTPNSSMGSSLGELLGESSAILESKESSSDGVLDIISTEKPGHSSSKSTSDVNSVAVTSTATAAAVAPDTATTVGEKPPLIKHASTEGVNTGSTYQRARSPRPFPNRGRANSYQNDLEQTNNENDDDDDDDDDDDENDIPPHIQSKIVEKSPAERYIRFKEKLGSGAYKDVYRAYDTIEGIEVAWNVVKLSGVPKAERVRIVNEVRLLERLHHPNIISFHGSWVNRETERVIFVTEILSSGTLKSFVQKVQLIRWKIFKRWAIQILKGLEYLHSQDPPIIHRDLKCDNIFINGTSGDLRIGDFGLSTAISKKNQKLSVLGTPEFMAPELYDENYNEKVDIYAFGMLLLEIITRDVPYHECTNPAQIYKKVTQGIPPSSLRRIKSTDARNFVLLCLGIGEDASSRPSASDLLKHEFLTTKLDDETTIEVEPAVEDLVIQEAKNSMSFSDTGSEKSGSNEGGGKKKEQSNSKYSSSIDGHEIPPRGKATEGKPPRKEQADALPRTNTRSMDSKDAKSGKDGPEVEDDHFGEMPENEANMKKVTVLMGRGTALDEGEPPAKEMEVVSLSSTPPPASIKTNSTFQRSASEADNSSLGSIPQYKVDAVPPVASLDTNGNKPYLEDQINLALTLPEENQTTIEFDFDLVNDDPVQVAREMVTELEEVPDDAVLGISEAISGVARQARMKQNQWTKQQQQQQSILQQQQQHSQSMMSMHSQGSVPMQQGIQAPQGIIMPPPQQHMYGSGYPPNSGYQNPGGLAQTQVGTPGNDPSQLQAQHQQPQTQPPIATQQQHLSQIPPPPPAQMSTPQPPSQTLSTPQLQHPMHVQHQQPVSMPPSPAPMPQSTQQQYPPPQPAIPRSNSMELPSHAGDLNSNPTAQIISAQPVVPRQHLMPPNTSQQDMITPRQLAPPPTTTDASSAVPHQSQNSAMQGVGSSSSSIPQNQQVQMPLHSQASMGSVEAEAEVDTEEIRRLELEFEKKMQRAKKSYGTRMDNLHRSKEEAEAQHQMTLEKHEKERIEFEKRVRLAEEEQARRLSQIQKEFMEKKKEARQQNHAIPPPSTTGAGTQPMQNGQVVGDVSKPPLHGGHKRSSSHFDSSLQPPIPLPELHKRNSSESDLNVPVEEKQPPPRPPNLPKPSLRPSTAGSVSNASARDRSGSTSS